MNDRMIYDEYTDDDDGGSNITNGDKQQKYFGIKSYLHNFYENVSNVRGSNSEYCDGDEYDHMTKFVNRKWSRSWIIVLICGVILMLIGIIMIVLGFTMNRLQIDIGYQEEMRIIDKDAYKFNEYLEKFKVIGLIFFTIGGMFVSSSLLLPSLIRTNSNDDASVGIMNESLHLKFNIDDMSEEKNNLIPITEEIENVQPKPPAAGAINTVITNAGLRQIHLN